MNTNPYMIGVCVGILAGLLAVLICRLAGRGRCAKTYDERQIAAQGKAAKAAYYTGMAYAAVCALADALLRPTWLTVAPVMFVGVILTTGVYAVFCVLHDAYFNLSDSPRRTMILWLMLTAVQFLNTWSAFSDGGLIEDGALNMRIVMSLSTGLLLLLVAVIAFVRLTLEKRSARDEES